MKKSTRTNRIAGLLSALRRRWGVKVLLVLCVAFVLCVNTYQNTLRSAKAYLSLNYENAAKGLYPNGTRFNMYDIISEDIVGQVIRENGLEDELTASDLSASLSVAPRYTRSTLEQYIGTEYTVQLRLKQPLEHLQTADLLMLICKAYSDFFKESYASNDTIYSYAVRDTSQSDYAEIGRLFQTSLSQIGDYLSRRNFENGVFRSEQTGETFASLNKRVTNFSSVLYQNYMAYIRETGVTRDEALARGELDYRQYLLNTDYDEQLLEYTARLEAIEKFSSFQNEIMLIPTYDSEGVFYMSRTRIGKDYLAKDAQAHMYTAKELQGQLLTNEMLLSKLRETGNEAQRKRADAMVNSMTTQLNELLETIKTTDDDFIAYTLYRCLSFRASKPGILVRYGVKETLIGAVLLYVAISVGQMLVRTAGDNRRKRGLLHSDEPDERQVAQP